MAYSITDCSAEYEYGTSMCKFRATAHVDSVGDGMLEMCVAFYDNDGNEIGISAIMGRISALNHGMMRSVNDTPFGFRFKYGFYIRQGTYGEVLYRSELYDMPEDTIGKAIEIAYRNYDSHHGRRNVLLKYNVTESSDYGVETEVIKYQNSDYPVAYVMRGRSEEISFGCSMVDDEDYEVLKDMVTRGTVWIKRPIAPRYGDESYHKYVIYDLGMKRSNNVSVFDVSFKAVRVNG